MNRAVIDEMVSARKRAGLTQRALAKRMRTSQATIARLETGKRTPGVTTLEIMARVTGHRLEVRLIPS